MFGSDVPYGAFNQEATRTYITRQCDPDCLFGQRDYGVMPLEQQRPIAELIRAEL